MQCFSADEANLENMTMKHDAQPVDSPECRHSCSTFATKESFDWFHVDSDVGFRAEFFLDPAFDQSRCMMSHLQSCLSVHPDVDFDGEMIADTSCAEMMGRTDFWK